MINVNKVKEKRVMWKSWLGHQELLTGSLEHLPLLDPQEHFLSKELRLGPEH